MECNVYIKEEPEFEIYDDINELEQYAQHKISGREIRSNSTKNTDGKTSQIKTYKKRMPTDDNVKSARPNAEYTCDVCHAEFTFAGNLKRHQAQMHSKVTKPLQCVECKNCYSRSDDLKYHVESKHRAPSKHSPIDRKIFPCHMCDKTYTKNYTLQMHLRSHNNYRPHACEICSKRYTTQDGLKKHMKTHDDRPEFQCDRCDKLFNYKGDLIRHVNMHLGIKTINCELCGKMFGRRCHLNIHLRMHKGEKPFACPLCDRHFRSKADVQTHVKIFDSKCASQTCGLCQQQFRSYTAYQKHIETYPGKEFFSCGTCQKKCHTVKQLRSHSEKHTERHPKIRRLVDSYECYICRELFETIKTLRYHIVHSHSLRTTVI